MTVILNISCEIALRWMPQDLINDINICSGNDAAPSGDTPLPESVLNQIYVALWRHWTTMS